MSSCPREMCLNWTGAGCVCEVLDIEPAEVCDHGQLASTCLACDDLEDGDQ